MSYDLLLKDATLHDGAGGEPRPGSVAVKDGRIVAIGDVEGEARQEIDCRGHVLAPGFIDMHSHADWVLPQPDHGEVLAPLVEQGITTPLHQLLPQPISELTQPRKVSAVPALQTFQLGQTILQFAQTGRVTVEARPVPLQVLGEVPQGRLEIQAALRKGLKGGIKLLHLLQFMATGQQMVDGGRGLIGSVLQTSDQLGQPLLQTHPVDQSVLLCSELTQLIGVIQGRGLQVLEQRLTFLQLILQLLSLGPGIIQTPGSIPPLQPTPMHLSRCSVQGRTAQTIKPAALLTGPCELLGLPLNGEINEQGTQRQDLLTVDRHAIDAGPAREAIVLTPPLAADHQLLLVLLRPGPQLLILQPRLRRGPWLKSRFNAGPGSIAAHQTGGGGSLQSTENRVEGVEQQRLSRTGFTGQNREPSGKIQLQAVDQSNLLESQTGQHGSSPSSG